MVVVICTNFGERSRQKSTGRHLRINPFPNIYPLSMMLSELKNFFLLETFLIEKSGNRQNRQLRYKNKATGENT